MNADSKLWLLYGPETKWRKLPNQAVFPYFLDNKAVLRVDLGESYQFGSLDLKILIC